MRQDYAKELADLEREEAEAKAAAEAAAADATQEGEEEWVGGRKPWIPPRCRSGAGQQDDEPNRCQHVAHL